MVKIRIIEITTVDMTKVEIGNQRTGAGRATLAPYADIAVADAYELTPVHVITFHAFSMFTCTKRPMKMKI